MSGMSSQRKGKRGEEELATILQQAGYSVRHGPSQSYGSCPDIFGLDGVHVECKRREKLNLSEAMNQAIRDAERFHDGAPCVFHRKNRESWRVTMRLEDWLELYQRGR